MEARYSLIDLLHTVITPREPPSIRRGQRCAYFASDLHSTDQALENIREDSTGDSANQGDAGASCCAAEALIKSGEGHMPVLGGMKIDGIVGR